MLKSPNTGSKTRLWVFYIFVILVHFLIIGRFFKIQIIDNEKYAKRAQSNYVRALTLPAPRGLILDRNGEIIVDNYPTYVLYAIEAEIKNKNKNYDIISRATGIDTSFLIKNFINYFFLLGQMSFYITCCRCCVRTSPNIRNLSIISFYII